MDNLDRLHFDLRAGHPVQGEAMQHSKKITQLKTVVILAMLVVHFDPQISWVYADNLAFKWNHLNSRFKQKSDVDVCAYPCGTSIILSQFSIDCLLFCLRAALYFAVSLRICERSMPFCDNSQA